MVSTAGVVEVLVVWGIVKTRVKMDGYMFLTPSQPTTKVTSGRGSKGSKKSQLQIFIKKYFILAE